MQCCLDSEYANAIAKKPRRVVAYDNALAHARLVELLQRVDDILASVFTAHNFEQPHEADRVEKMRDRKFGLKRLRHILDQQRNRDR